MDIAWPCPRELCIATSDDVNILTLQPIMWITDEMMDRATWIAPITGRHEGDPKIEISSARPPQRTTKPISDAEYELLFNLKVTLIPDGKPRAVYLLESDRRDFAACTTRMRWPD